MSLTLSGRFLALLLAVFAVFALTLATACGGDDDDTDDVGIIGPGATAEDGGDDDDDGGEETDGPDEGDEDGDDDSGDDDGDSGDGPDACGLLTTEEVSAALGAEVGEGEPFNLEPFYDCTWTTDQFDSVSVSVTVGEGGESLYEFNNDDAEEIDGLGDRAQYLSDFLGLLEVLEDDYYLSVSFSATELDEEERRAQSIALAEIALGRLD